MCIYIYIYNRRRACSGAVYSQFLNRVQKNTQTNEMTLIDSNSNGIQGRQAMIVHTCHIIPPSEIDLGLFWADFTDLEGKHLFHRIG